jgi:hypothetical protein
MQKEVRVPTNTVIDAATVSTAMSALRLGASEEISSWEALCLVGATRNLLEEGVSVTLAPGVEGGSQKLGGVYADVVSALEVKPEVTEVTSEVVKSTDRWVRAYKNELLSYLDSIRNDKSFSGWIDRNMRWVGETHTSLYKGLFEMQMIPAYAEVLGASEKDLTLCYKKSLSKDYHNRVASPQDDLSRLAQKAYMLSAIVRGHWHQEISRQRGTSLFSHPFRWCLSESFSAAESSKHVIASKSETYLLQILVGSALRQESEDERIRTWLSNLKNLRAMRRAGKLAFPTSDDDKTSWKHAEFLACEAQFSLTGQRFQRCLDFSASMLFGVGLGFFVSPWLAAGVGASLATLSLKKNSSLVNQLITTSTKVTNLQYRELAKMVPGSVRHHLGELKRAGRDFE